MIRALDGDYSLRKRDFMSKSNDKKLWVGRLHKVQWPVSNNNSHASLKTVVSDKFDAVDTIVAYLSKIGVLMSAAEKKSVNDFIEAGDHMSGISITVCDDNDERWRGDMVLSFWRVE